MGAWLVMGGQIKTLWPGVWSWLGKFGSLAWSIVTGPFRLLKAMTMGVWNWISNSTILTRIWTGLTTALGTAWAFIKSAAFGILNYIKSSTIGTAIWGAISNGVK